MYMIEVKNITKSYGKKQNAFTALDDVSLEIPEGTTVAILGKSGSGKSTLMHAMSGLDRPEAGEILVDGKNILTLNAKEVDRFRAEKIGFIFQSFFVQGNESVYDNVSLPLEIANVPSSKRKTRVEAALAAVELSDKIKNKAKNLSGGQKQRLAIARAIVNEPEVLLLDEPLSALDLKLRKELQVELSNLQETLGMTFVFVTHDQEEALVMSDRIAVMNRGRVEQLGRAEDLYERPRTAFVANFLGSSNLIPGTIQASSETGATVLTPHGPLRTVYGAGLRPGKEVTLSIRPEKLRMERDDETEGNEVRARVDDIVYTGAENQYLLEAGGQRLVAFQLNADIGADEDFDYDEEVALYLPPESLVILEEA